MFIFTLPTNQPPLPLQNLLRHLKVSLTRRRKLKQAEQAIRVNGQVVGSQTVVNPGDTLTILWPSDCTITPLPMDLAIYFEDESLLVVDKPAGLLVHPTTQPQRPSLANGVIWHLRAGGSAAGFHPIHRLDRNTSGLLLIAKNPYIQHLLSSENGIAIQRSYLALATGVVDPPIGNITAPIARHPDSIIQRIVHPEGQHALTCYETIQPVGSNSLLRLKLMTGRTHQIRVHLAYIGHPILGDDLYGGSTQLIGRQALHATDIAFIHPLTKESINLTSPLPEDMAQLID